MFLKTSRDWHPARVHFSTQWMVSGNALEVEVSVEAGVRVGARARAAVGVEACPCLLTQTRIDMCQGHRPLPAQAIALEAEASHLIE